MIYSPHADALTTITIIFETITGLLFTINKSVCKMNLNIPTYKIIIKELTIHNSNHTSSYIKTFILYFY